jgi:hypothetical protein
MRATVRSLKHLLAGDGADKDRVKMELMAQIHFDCIEV